MSKQNSPEDLRDKKSAVLGSAPGSSRRPLIVLIVAAFALTAALAYYMIDRPKSLSAAAPPIQAVALPQKTNEVSIPIDQISDGKAHFFEHRSGSATIRYFVIKSADGVLRAAFDACDVCWPAGKGYEQHSDDMVCRNCGRKFASTSINEVSGGCNPAPLKRTIIDNRLIISLGDIEQGLRYFDFKKGA